MRQGSTTIGLTGEQGGGRLTAALVERVDRGAQHRMMVRDMQGIPVLESLLPYPFRALFTTRLGGESTGLFSSLNLDPRSEDDLDAVARNRARVASMLQRQLISPAQVHGLRVAGAAEYLQEQPDSPCDGLTLHPELDKGLAALLLFADCVPVVLCGEVDMAVVHGGWRGILGGVVQQAGRAMIGAPAIGFIGPSIGPCCFTVEEELAVSFAARFGPDVVIEPRKGGGPSRVDLWMAVTKALVELGIPPSQVVNPRLCTACNVDFFYSYRREGPVTGRQGCVAWTVAP